MSEVRSRWPGDPESGAAGKVLLIIAAVVVLLSVAVIALWKPVIQPLVGEAVPERVTKPTVFEVPHDDPQFRVTVPTGWVVQRALYRQEQAVLRSPDFSTTITIDTWKHGAAPTLKRAIAEAVDGWDEASEPRVEQLTDALVVASAYGREKAASSERMVLVIGQGTDSSARGRATLTVTSERDTLDEVLPALAEIVASGEAPE